MAYFDLQRLRHQAADPWHHQLSKGPLILEVLINEPEQTPAERQAVEGCNPYDSYYDNPANDCCGEAMGHVPCIKTHKRKITLAESKQGNIFILAIILTPGFIRPLNHNQGHNSSRSWLA